MADFVLKFQFETIFACDICNNNFIALHLPSLFLLGIRILPQIIFLLYQKNVWYWSIMMPTDTDNLMMEIGRFYRVCLSPPFDRN